MSVAVELSDELVSRARKESAESGRSVAEQIEFRYKLSCAVEDNPDLPAEFVKGILEGLEEGDDDLVPYEFGPLREDENCSTEPLRKSG